MALSSYTKPQLFQRAIDKVSKLNGLVQVVEGPGGTIQYRSSFDGKTFDEIPQAIGHIEATGINDYRVFGPSTQVGSKKGLDQIASESLALSERLKNLTTTQREAIDRLGLGFLIDKDIDITYQKFNYGGESQKLAQIAKSSFVKNAGIVNITDEGVTVLNYSVGKKVLTAEQAKDMKYVLGLGTLTDNFISKTLGDNGVADFGGFAKLPKRIQGMLSERDVSLTGKAVEDIFAPVSSLISGKEGKAGVYDFDDVSSFFRGLLGGETSEAERFLLASGMGFEQSALKRVTEADLDIQFARGLDKKFAEIAGFSNLKPDQLEEILSAMKSVFVGSAGGDFKSFEKQFKEAAKANEAIGPIDASTVQKINASFGGVEKMRDGEFVADVRIVDKFIEDLQKQRQNLVELPGKLSPDKIKEISEIDSQLEGLLHLRQSGQEGLDSAIGRINFPGGQGKGEMFLRKFEWLPKELRDKLLIMPQSATKSEVQGLPSILLNIAKTHSENIYADPLMLLYHQDYFDDSFLKGAVNNVDKQMQSIQSFLETGALPEDVRKEIFGSINSQLKEDPKIVAKMDAAASASYIRNRSEVKAIQDAILAGEDPRKIPALVRRITDYYSTNAFRIKQTARGERVDLVMPDTMRLALRSYESSLEPGQGAKLFQSANINLKSLGTEGVSYSAMTGSDQAAINLVQFRIQGNRMMFSGPNAHLYHHSLGTFDLDDKGVPKMTTFTDANGNDRLAFMTMRQPTGFQEKIFMQGDLTDTSTLRTILQKSSGDFGSLLNDADAVGSLSDPKEQRILSLLRSAINEKGNLDTQGLDSSDIEKVIVKLRNGFGSKHGFEGLSKITNRDLLEMAVTKSSSALGLDKVIRAGIGGTTTLKGFTDYMAEMGIAPDSMPSYTRGNFVSLLAEEQTNVSGSQIVNRFNAALGKSFSTTEDIQNYINTLSDADKLVAQAKLGTVIDTVNVQLQLNAAIDVENSLGMYINRQAAAMSVEGQVGDVLESLSGSSAGKIFKTEINGNLVDLSLEDFFRVKFSSLIIPPSEAVDVSKSLVGQMVMKQDQMRAIAIAADQLRGTSGVSEEAVERMIREYSGRSLKLGEAGQEVLSQTSKGVGFLRAMQIAQGTAADQLIGFDAALFGESASARIRKKDRLTTVESVIAGANEYLSQITDNTERGRVQSFINELSATGVEEAIAKITLETGSRYAVLQKYTDAANAARAKMDTMSSFAKRLARAGSDPFEAFMQAEYMSGAEALVESQKRDIDRLVDIASSFSDNLQDDVLSSITTPTISGNLYEGLSAMVEGDPSKNILDAFDTLEATIRTQYGQRIANKILSSDTDIQGMENALVKIREDARSRRVKQRTVRRVSDDAYDGIVGLASGEGFSATRARDITVDGAKEYLNYIRDYQRYSERVEGLTAEEFFESRVDQDLYDFMRLRTGRANLLVDQDITEQASDVFARVQAEEELDVINGRTSSDYAISGSDIGDDARRLIADADAADNITSVQKGTYTRIQDFIKNGSMRELFDDKIIRGSAFAVAGLAAFGFIYSARKERTQDEMTGPPLLPGGSAYESDFPRNIPSISDLKYLNPTTLGMQYKINMSGSQKDIEKMQYLAGGVVDGNVDSTIYNSLPRLGRDPYSEVASRF